MRPRTWPSFVLVVVVLSLSNDGRATSATPLTRCLIETPEAAPARFLSCDAVGAERVLAGIITPGSHCVPGEVKEPVALDCADGTQIELRGGECHLLRDGNGHLGTWDCETSRGAGHM